MLGFFIFVVFLTGKRSKHKNYECDGLGNSISYKMVYVSPPWSKTVGEDAFLVVKEQFFRGGKNTS